LFFKSKIQVPFAYSTLFRLTVHWTSNIVLFPTWPNYKYTTLQSILTDKPVHLRTTTASASFDACWRVITDQHHGPPQHRRRGSRPRTSVVSGRRLGFSCKSCLVLSSATINFVSVSIHTQGQYTLRARTATSPLTCYQYLKSMRQQCYRTYDSGQSTNLTIRRSSSVYVYYHRQ